MIGTRLDHYKITAHLGSGGFGDVYQAADTKLGRSVAIKLLPQAFARDAERVARFQREARLLASLNHPNIATLYGMEQADGRHFLVMELVEGDTLRERVARDGAVPIEETMKIAVQIAEALEHAHEKTVVHRDLKLANIKVTPEGRVKVLDFGLAKAYAPDPTEADPSDSPTLTTMATEKGVILGTAAYMSPEQAKGREVDGRSDIFAFGAVLYEMLTGKPAFDGEDLQDILGAVLKSEPDWTRLPPEVPPRILELLRHCLQKDKKKRRQSATDVRLDLENAATEPAGATLVPSPPEKSAAKRSLRVAEFSAVVATAAAVALAIAYFRSAQPSPPELRLEITTPQTSSPLHFALSPDGRNIAFVARGDSGPERVWLRPLDKAHARPMPGTEGAQLPFWSPDGRSIGFFASGKLYRIDIAGDPPQALTDAPSGRGGSWSRDGVIVFATVNAPILRIAASGGDPVPVTRLDPPRQVRHRLPHFLPDGRHFLFYAQGSQDGTGIYLGSLDGGEPKRLAANDTAAAYLAPDRVAYVRQGTLVAQQLDVARGELAGDPETLADSVGEDLGFPLGGFSVSGDGRRVAYRQGGTLRQLTWYDRTGKQVSMASRPDGNFLNYPELSPDGRRVAVDRTVQNNRDVWEMDLERGGLLRFTFDAALDNAPIWSPEGARIAFRSARKGTGDLYVKPSSGAGKEELVLQTPNNKIPQDWSKDGRFLLYWEQDPKTGWDLKALQITANERKPVIVVNTAFDERYGQFSPDGRWVAYATNESGQYEIVVQPFPEPTGKWQISTGGGREPRWRADGRELYFVAPDGKLMAAPVAVSGSTIQAGRPVALFATRIAGTVAVNARPQYAVSRDGRFLINETAEEAASPITLILNWSPEPGK